MKRANKYQVGDILNLKRDDPIYDDYPQAIQQAYKLCQPDNIIGIWSSQEEGSELLALVYLGEVFEK